VLNCVADLTRFLTAQHRDAYLNNWLVNLSGLVLAFKEIDLLQEHQNFWAKVSTASAGDFNYILNLDLNGTGYI
jgi:hypothetical protein